MNALWAHSICTFHSEPQNIVLGMASIVCATDRSISRVQCTLNTTPAQFTRIFHSSPRCRRWWSDRFEHKIRKLLCLYISLGCGHSGSNEIITRRATIWMQWKWMRRQWWRCAEVNTWTEFIYCDRLGRIGCHRQPANVDVYFACGTATHRLYSDAYPRPTNAVFTGKKGGKRFCQFFSYFSFLRFVRFLRLSLWTTSLHCHSYAHTHTTIASFLRCVLCTHNSYLHDATKWWIRFACAKKSTCKL